MTIAFLPWPTSICESPGVSEKLPSAQRLSIIQPRYTGCPNDLVQCFFLSHNDMALWPMSWVYSFPLCPQASFHAYGGASSYLAGGDELQRPEGSAHVRDVGLELVERSRDAGLNLARLGARGRVGGDLVQGLLRHGGGVLVDWIEYRSVVLGRTSKQERSSQWRLCGSCCSESLPCVLIG